MRPPKKCDKGGISFSFTGMVAKGSNTAPAATFFVLLFFFVNGVSAIHAAGPTCDVTCPFGSMYAGRLDVSPLSRRACTVYAGTVESEPSRAVSRNVVQDSRSCSGVQ